MDVLGFATIATASLQISPKCTDKFKCIRRIETCNAYFGLMNSSTRFLSILLRLLMAREQHHFWPLRLLQLVEDEGSSFPLAVSSFIHSRYVDDIFGLIAHVKATLKLKVGTTHLTNSQVTLIWIRSNVSRWKDYVRNRVAQIQGLCNTNTI